MDRPATISEAVREFTHNSADLNPKRCACRDGGWILSPYNTWEKCPVHFRNQRHPEDYDQEETMNKEMITQILEENQEIVRELILWVKLRHPTEFLTHIALDQLRNNLDALHRDIQELK